MENVDTWEAFGSKYLKAEDVANNTDRYVIVAADSKNEDGKNKVIFTVERNGFEKLFGCNATNEQAVRWASPKGPKYAIGREVVFNKVKTTNPTTKQEVDGLRIQFIHPDQTSLVKEVTTDEQATMGM